MKEKEEINIGAEVISGIIIILFVWYAAIPALKMILKFLLIESYIK